MSVAIPLAESTPESIIPVRWPALAGGARTGNAILALEPDRTIGWGVRNNDGAIASHMAESRSGGSTAEPYSSVIASPGWRRSTRAAPGPH